MEVSRYREAIARFPILARFHVGACKCFTICLQRITDARSILFTSHILIFWRVVIGTQHELHGIKLHGRRTSNKKGEEVIETVCPPHITRTYTVLFVFISILYRIPYQHQPSPPLRPLPLSRFRNASPPSPVRHPTNQKPVQPHRKKSPSKAIKSMPICGRQGRHSLRCRPSVPGANGFMKPAGLHDVVFKDRFAHCHDWKRRLVHSFVPLVSLGEATMKSRQ